MVGYIAAALAPYLADAIGGGNSGVDEALNKKNALLQSIMERVKKQAGSNPLDSQEFKTQKALINKNQKRALDMIIQNKATTGQTDEATLGEKANLNNSYQDATLDALMKSLEERKRLMAYYDQLSLGRADSDLSLAQSKRAQLQKAGARLGALMPYIFKNTATPPDVSPESLSTNYSSSWNDWISKPATP